MTAPRSTLARAAQQVASYQRRLVHNLVLTVLTVLAVLAVRPTRQRAELIGAARLDRVIATTNPAKGVR